MSPRSIIYILKDVMLLIQFSLWYELSSALISVNQPRRSARALCLAITQKTRWKELERWNGLFGIRTCLYKHLRQDEKRWNMKAVKNLKKWNHFHSVGALTMQGILRKQNAFDLNNWHSCIIFALGNVPNKSLAKMYPQQFSRYFWWIIPKEPP